MEGGNAENGGVQYESQPANVAASVSTNSSDSSIADSAVVTSLVVIVALLAALFGCFIGERIYKAFETC